MLSAKFASRGSWAFKISVALGLTLFGDWLFYQQGRSGGAYGIYGLLIAAAILTANPAVRRRPAALAALAAASFYAIATVVSPSIVAWLMFWAAAVLAVLIPKTVRFDDGWRWLQRLLGHSIFSLAGPLPDLRRARKVRTRRGSAQRRAILPLIILPLLGSGLFLLLFAYANPVIGNWFASLRGPSIDATFSVRVALWIILVWISWAVLRPRIGKAHFGLFDGTGDLAIPLVSTASVAISLLAFNSLFLVQNAMDAAWLWGLVPLPEGITLANYAHRGAYPLFLTSLLAALFVLVTLRPGSQTARVPLVRRLVGFWIAQNLFLVFNAALRTIDYVEAYSLTVLRISALLWMMLVAIGLILILVRMLAGKSSQWLVNANLAASAIVLSAVCAVDLGSVAAWWNVRHAREVDGTGAQLDLCYLHSLGDSALLPLIELEQRQLDPGLKSRVVNARVSLQQQLDWRLENGGWSLLAARRQSAARRLVGDLAPAHRQGRRFQCATLPYAAAQQFGETQLRDDDAAHLRHRSVR